MVDFKDVKEKGPSSQSQEVIDLLSEKAREKGKSLMPIKGRDARGEEFIRGYGFSLNIGSGEGPAGFLNADYWVGTDEDPGLYEMVKYSHKPPRVENIDPKAFFDQFNKFLEEPPLVEIVSPSQSLSSLLCRLRTFETLLVFLFLFL